MLPHLSMLYDRLLKWWKSASTGTIQLTGILGLAVLLAIVHRFRSNSRGGRTNRDQPRQNESSSAAGTTAARGQPNTSGAPSTQPRTPAAPAPPAAKTSAPTTAPAIPVPSSVRSALNGVRKLTMSVPGVLLLEWQAHELSDSATIRSQLVALVKQIAAISDVYLIAHVMDDVGQAAVTGALEECGIVGYEPGCIKPHRLLFCSTLEGKVSIVRQLEPDLHIDGHASTIQDLQRFMPQLLHVTESASSSPASAQPNVAQCHGLKDFFRL